MLSPPEFKEIVALLKPAQTAFLFCKKNNLVFDQKNLLLDLAVNSQIGQKPHFPIFLKQQISFPLKKSTTFLTKNWAFLFRQVAIAKAAQKQKA